MTAASHALRRFTPLLALFWLAGPTPAPTSVDYTLTVDSAGAWGVAVDMRVHGAPAEFRVAMATHTEYDDQYWRHVTGVSASSALGPVTVAREDSAVWRVQGPAGDVALRYRVQYPEVSPQQSSWKAHLRPGGGLVGGPHSFFYVVGAEHAPARLTLTLPPGWRIATALEQSPAGTFAAPDAVTLIDSPILVGDFEHWEFRIDGVPHEIAFLGAPGGVPFDTARLVSNVERLARQSAHDFQPLPYRRYQFLFEDGTNGGLEHVNSVSIGIRSANLARDPNAYLGQIAHEFFHTWNEVHIRPASWIGLRHTPPDPTGVLWFSEGVTLYYADLMLRRAGLHTVDSTRIAHLERLLTVYLANPSHGMVAPEETSRAFNLQAATGDYTPSIFTQGEMLGLILDIMIRDRSAGRRSLDDVIRSFAAHFDPAHGIEGADIERAVGAACACDAHPFFMTHVVKARPLDIDGWLAVMGLRSAVSWVPARAPDSSLVPDTRILAFVRPGEAGPRLLVWFPGTVWGRAGLHTGDRLVSWNGAAVSPLPELREEMSRLHIGDTVRVRVQRDSAFDATVVVTGFDRPVVRISPRGDASAAQRALLAGWLAGR